MTDYNRRRYDINIMSLSDCVMIEGNWANRFDEIFATFEYIPVSKQKFSSWDEAADFRDKLMGRRSSIRIYKRKGVEFEAIIVGCGEWTHIWNGYSISSLAKEELEALSQKLKSKIFAFSFESRFDSFSFTLYDSSIQRDLEICWDDDNGKLFIETNFGKPLAEETFDLENFDALETANTFPYLVTKQVNEPSEYWVLEFDMTTILDPIRKLQKPIKPWWKFW